GRVVRGANGDIARIVEEKEAEDWEREIREVNTGIYLARLEDILDPLRKVQKSIVKGEYYLTDLIEGLIADGKRVATVQAENEDEVRGVNTRAELAQADGVLQARLRRRWMEEGVTMILPETIRIDADAALEPDAVLHPGVVIQGASRIGRGAEIL